MTKESQDKPTIASLDEIDYRTRVGSKAWEARNTPNAQRLSAWRRLHALLPHNEVVKLASPNDDPEKLAKLVQELEAKKK